MSAKMAHKKREVLQVLAGAAAAGKPLAVAALIERTGIKAGYISDIMTSLMFDELVKSPARGFYTITPKGRTWMNQAV